MPRIIAFSIAIYGNMIQNLWWAAGYNVFAIPLRLECWQASAFSSARVRSRVHVASTAIVAVNAQLLGRAQL